MLAAVALPFKWQAADWGRFKFNLDFKRKHCEIQVNCNIIVVAVHLYLTVRAAVALPSKWQVASWERCKIKTLKESSSVNCWVPILSRLNFKSRCEQSRCHQPWSQHEDLTGSQTLGVQLDDDVGTGLVACQNKSHRGFVAGQLISIAYIVRYM